jgi:two-component system capsular synthesis response regulator RcsB
MFQKVIIAEDVDSMNIGVVRTLGDLEIPTIDHVKYCDEALLKLRKAMFDGCPYELLITDLSFQTDHREVRLIDGVALVEAVRKVQPDLPIIVLSVEDRPFRIKSLFGDFNISGYIVKGRKSMEELKQAIIHIKETGQPFTSPQISHILSDRQFDEIAPYDQELLKLLAEGLSQSEVANRFRELGITPNGTSSIEKRISTLKTYFKANNNVHLVVIAKDFGLV